MAATAVDAAIANCSKSAMDIGKFPARERCTAFRTTVPHRGCFRPDAAAPMNSLAQQSIGRGAAATTATGLRRRPCSPAAPGLVAAMDGGGDLRRRGWGDFLHFLGGAQQALGNAGPVEEHTAG